MPKVSKQCQSIHLYNCEARLVHTGRPRKSVSESNFRQKELPHHGFKRSDANHIMSPQKRKVSFESCSSHSASFANSSYASLSQDLFKRSHPDVAQEERSPISSSSCEIQKPRLSRSFCLQSLVDADDSNSHSTSYSDSEVQIDTSQSLPSRRRRLRAESVSLPISASATTSSPPSSSWGHFVDVIPMDHDDVLSSSPHGRKKSSRLFTRYSPYSQYWFSPSKKTELAKSFKTSSTNDEGISAALRKVRI